MLQKPQTALNVYLIGAIFYHLSCEINSVVIRPFLLFFTIHCLLELGQLVLYVPFRRSRDMYLSGGIPLLVVVCCIGHCKPYKYGIQLFWETFVKHFHTVSLTNTVFSFFGKHVFCFFAFSTLSRFFLRRDQFYQLAGCLWQLDGSSDSNLALFLFQQLRFLKQAILIPRIEGTLSSYKTT